MTYAQELLARGEAKGRTEGEAKGRVEGMPECEQRGKVAAVEGWLAALDPIRGSEQGGTRPVLTFQRDLISRFTTTVITLPFTTDLRRGSLPSRFVNQIRVLDKRRLQRRIGHVSKGTSGGDRKLRFVYVGSCLKETTSVRRKKDGDTSCAYEPRCRGLHSYWRVI